MRKIDNPGLPAGGALDPACWAMGGENQVFSDMQGVEMQNLLRTATAGSGVPPAGAGVRLRAR